MRLSRKRHTSGDPDEYTSGYGVKALSYCDLHAVTLTDLMAVLDDYPEFADDFLHQLVVTFCIQHEVRIHEVRISGQQAVYFTRLLSEIQCRPTVTDNSGPLKRNVTSSLLH